MPIFGKWMTARVAPPVADAPAIEISLLPDEGSFEGGDGAEAAFEGPDSSVFEGPDSSVEESCSHPVPLGDAELVGDRLFRAARLLPTEHDTELESVRDRARQRLVASAERHNARRREGLIESDDLVFPAGCWQVPDGGLGRAGRPSGPRWPPEG